MGFDIREGMGLEGLSMLGQESFEAINACGRS